MTTALHSLTAPHAPALGAYPAPHAAAREPRTRRLLNVLVAAVGIVLALPLMLLIAVLIKLTSRGPVFFTQMRIGMDRRAVSHVGRNTRGLADVGCRP